MRQRMNASINLISRRLVFERRATHEFTHNTGGWYLFVAHRQEKVDELHQAVSFGILRTVLGNRSQDNLCMDAQHGKLNVEG